MSPFDLFLYCVAAAFGLLAVGLALLALFALFCWLMAGVKR